MLSRASKLKLAKKLLGGSLPVHESGAEKIPKLSQNRGGW